MEILRIGIAAVALVGSAIGMEFVARVLHKYVMHGQGWCLHADHHRSTGRVFQKNDLYFLLFAAISTGLVAIGIRSSLFEITAAGVGVAIYGVGYVVFHDIMFHGRIRGLKFSPRHPYLRRIVNAHRMHHATVTRGSAVSFHFLWAPRFYDEANREAIDAKLREIREMQRAIREPVPSDGTGPAHPSE